MILKEKDFDILLEYAKKAALAGGEVILSKQSEPVERQKKEGFLSVAAQVVTEVDIASQKVILEILSKSCKDYDLAVLAEESEDSGERFIKDYFWSIDPLDGTLAFVNSKPGYSVSVALVDKLGEAVLAAVFDPVEKTLFYSQKNKGSFMNAKKIEINQNYNRDSFLLVTDEGFLSSKNFDLFKTTLETKLFKKGFKTLDIVVEGGAVMCALKVVSTPCSCFFKFPKKENGGGSLWDYAATAVIINQAGGECCDMFGKKLNLNSSQSLYMNKYGVLYAPNKEIKDVILSFYQELSL